MTLRQELEVLFLSMQRTLILKAVRLQLAWSSNESPYTLDAGSLLGSADEDELNRRLAWIKSQKARPLARWAMRLHLFLDNAQRLKSAALFVQAWYRALLWWILPSLRQRGYARWVRLHDSVGEVDLGEKPKADLILIDDGPAFNFKKSEFSGTVDRPYVIIQFAEGELSRDIDAKVNDFLSRNSQAEILYGDFDHTRWGRRVRPYFFSDWDIDSCLSQNFFSSIVLLRTEVFMKIPDQVLSSRRGLWAWLMKACILRDDRAEKMGHVPEILFHKKEATQIDGLTGEWGRACVEAYGDRLPNVQIINNKYGVLRALWPLPERQPKVSLIVPTKDKSDLLRPLLEGLLHSTAYSDFEVLIVNNRSVEEATFRFFDEIQRDQRVRVLDYDAPFNYSAINNFAFSHSKGEIIGLLNNDIEILHSDWLTELVRDALRPDVGAVGAKLLYRNGFIQHAGVVLGLFQVCAHIHRMEHGRSRGYCNRLLFTQQFSAVTGACLFVRRSVYEKVNGLDEENLAVAYNDVDFCLRIKEAGWKILWSPNATLLHLESATRPPDSRPEQVLRYQKEVNYMRERWKSYLSTDPFYNRNLTKNSYHFELPNDRK